MAEAYAFHRLESAYAPARRRFSRFFQYLEGNDLRDR
jgi:hypothetical protein